MGVGFYPTSRFLASSHCGSRWNGVGQQVKASRLAQNDIPLRGPKEIQCGATLGMHEHALASVVCDLQLFVPMRLVSLVSDTLFSDKRRSGQSCSAHFLFSV